MSDETRAGDAPGSGREGEWSRGQFWYNVAGAARITPDGEIREANPALARLLGAEDPWELEGRNVMEFHPTPGEGPALIRKLRSEGAFTWEEIPLIHAAGRAIWTLSNAQVVRRDDGSTEIFATVVDITERKRSERHRRRLAALVEQSRDAIIGKSLDGTIVSWNPAAERMYGWSAEEAIGRPATMLVPPDREEEYEQLLARAARDEEGQLIGMSGIDRDMSVRKELEEHLEELAFEDPLTGLFNRRALALADRHGESLAVLYVDLVGFKQINDRLGHAAGDEVLVRVARRLDETGRESDTVARMGGREFVILLGEADGEASARTAGRPAAAHDLCRSCARRSAAGRRGGRSGGDLGVGPAPVASVPEE